MVITVHADRIVRHDADRFFGINLNYVRDRDSNRPGARSLDLALNELGVRWLRYPGGEKSNYYQWAEPPYEKPAPRSLGWYATPQGDRMDFDEFIRHARAARVEPYVVVGCASADRTGRTWQQWRESAVAWVRYARAKHYEVRYWEIGNENWNKGIPPGEMASIVTGFSRAMKAADPMIKIGASGDKARWWSSFLPVAAHDIDFLSVSEYTGWEWNGYSHFLSRPNLGETAMAAVEAIRRYAPAADRARLRVIVAETNTKDYSKPGWPDANDLGHALATFATLGRLVEEPNIEAAMVWTTRWMSDQVGTSPFYALDPANEPTPTGQALRAWGAFVRTNLLETEGSGRDLDVFAARSDNGEEMTVWLLNRGSSSQDVDLRIDNLAYRSARIDRFSGSGAADTAPKWSRPAENLPARLRNVTLSPYSITILSLRQ